MNHNFNIKLKCSYVSCLNQVTEQVLNDTCRINQKGGISKDLLECLLIEAIKRMGIENVHYAGSEDYNYNASVHIQVDLSFITMRQ